MLAIVLALPAFAEPTRVTLVTSGDTERSSAFEASLRELLERLKLTLDVRGDGAQAPPKGEALAAVDADFTDPELVTLTVVDALGRTVLLRRLGHSPTRQLQVEAAAHVVQSVMEELVAASKWKPPVVEPPPLAEPPLETATVEEKKPAPVVPHEQSRFGLDLGAFFGGRTFLNRAPITPGGGVSASLAVRVGNFRPMLTVLGDYHAPFETGSDDQLVTLRIETLSVRALATLDVLGGDAFRVDVGIGGGADVFFSRPQSSVLPEQFLRARTDADPIITAMITGRLAIASSVDIFLSFALDIDTWPLRYIENNPMMQSRVLYTPFPVRPTLALGFSFNAFGSEPYR